jgi:hypothetical protein
VPDIEELNDAQLVTSIAGSSQLALADRVSRAVGGPRAPAGRGVGGADA